MFNKCFVVIISKNMSDGVAQTITDYKTEKEAKDKFYDALSSYGGNPQVKTVRVLLLNADGMQIKDEIVDNSKYIEPTEEA